VGSSSGLTPSWCATPAPDPCEAGEGQTGRPRGRHGRAGRANQGHWARADGGGRAAGTALRSQS